MTLNKTEKDEWSNATARAALVELRRDYVQEIAPSSTPNRDGDYYGGMAYVEYETAGDVKDMVLGLVEDKEIEAASLLGIDVDDLPGSETPSAVRNAATKQVYDAIKGQFMAGVRAANAAYRRTEDRDTAAKAFIKAAGKTPKF